MPQYINSEKNYDNGYNEGSTMFITENIHSLLPNLSSTYGVYTEDIGDTTSVGGERYAKRTSNEPALFINVSSGGYSGWGVVSNSDNCTFDASWGYDKQSFEFNSHTYYLYYLASMREGYAVYGDSIKTGNTNATLGNVISVEHGDPVIIDGFFNIYMSLFDHYVYGT